MVISVIALVAALGGTGYAASSIVSPKATASKVPKSVKKAIKKAIKAANVADAAGDATASVKHASTADTSTTASSANFSNFAGAANTANTATNAGHATRADTAGKVDQLQLAGGFKLVSATHGTDEPTARGAAPEIPLFKYGPLDVYAKCFTDDSGPTTHAVIYMRSTKDGSIKLTSGSGFSLEGQTGVRGFLNTSTVEEDTTNHADRILQDTNIGANSANFNSGTRFFGAAPDGTGIAGQVSSTVKNGTGSNGDGIYGSGDHCVFGGFNTGP
jgi:hypothetical protein